jgi:hypothetical protein
VPPYKIQSPGWLGALDYGNLVLGDLKSFIILRWFSASLEHSTHINTFLIILITNSVSDWSLYCRYTNYIFCDSKLKFRSVSMGFIFGGFKIWPLDIFSSTTFVALCNWSLLFHQMTQCSSVIAMASPRPEQHETKSYSLQQDTHNSISNA